MGKHIRYDEDGAEAEEECWPVEDAYTEQEEHIEEEEEVEFDNYIANQLDKENLVAIKSLLKDAGFADYVKSQVNMSKDDREFKANINLASKVLAYLHLHRNKLTENIDKYSSFDVTTTMKWFYAMGRERQSLMKDFFLSLKEQGVRPSTCKKYLTHLRLFIE